MRSVLLTQRKSIFSPCHFLSTPNKHLCTTLVTYQVWGIDLFYLVLLLPCLIFLAFLLKKLRLSVKILKKTESLLLHVLFTFVWGIVTINLIASIAAMLLSSTTSFVQIHLLVLIFFFTRHHRMMATIIRHR